MKALEIIVDTYGCYRLKLQEGQTDAGGAPYSCSCSLGGGRGGWQKATRSLACRSTIIIEIEAKLRSGGPFSVVVTVRVCSAGVKGGRPGSSLHVSGLARF